MRYLDLTLPTVAENLALDSALLDEAEAAEHALETLRIWESPETAVVVGRSSRPEVEVDLAACRREGVAVLRRDSGGAAVVIGPGCLMYALVLSQHRTPGLRRIDAIHGSVLGQLGRALKPLVPGVTPRGTSDLAVGGRKVSGNSVRIKRQHFLYHGTLLYDFPLERIGRLLRRPPRMPEYRAGRPHEQFVTNLPVAAGALIEALRVGWQADRVDGDWPRQGVERLVAEQYERGDRCICG
ncbi:MAG: lipoate--protein ligase family protein [Pirellulales bacterium]